MDSVYICSGFAEQNFLLFPFTCRKSCIIFWMPPVRPKCWHHIWKSTCCCSCWVTKLCLFATPRTAVPQAPLCFSITQSLLKFTSIQSVMLSKRLILCHLLLLLPSVFPSIKVSSSESAFHIRWLNYRSFSVSPSKNYSGLISFKINWFDLLIVQGALKSLLQHHNLKASFFGAQPLWSSSQICT